MIAIEQVMRKETYYISDMASIVDAAKMMKTHSIDSLLVKQDTNTVGILTENDFTQKVIANNLNPSQTQIKDIMSSPVLSIDSHQSVVDAEELMTRHHIRHLLVVSNDNVIGIVSIRDLLLPLKYFENLSSHDGLTGLLTNREFYQRLKEEILRSNRFNHTFCLLMLDIDHFKAVNDQYGHLSGDDALRVISKTIQEEIRAIDQAARYGGEEFAIILPETNLKNAKHTAEKIRKAVASQSITIAAKQSFKLTISIGISVFPTNANFDQKLVSRADSALYKAKKRGRNRVCCFEEPTELLLE